ncbi:unnamed protein product [Lathyrus sativus]|nr:unnamed protein product [Lathyrus sativus]
MSSRVMKNLLAMLEAEEAEAWKSSNLGTATAFNYHDTASANPYNNHGTANAFNNYDTASANPYTNHGTANAFNNHGWNQNFSSARINSGANSWDRKKYRTTHNVGGRTVNNSGTFHGNGNGGYTERNSEVSTINYYK